MLESNVRIASSVTSQDTTTSGFAARIGVEVTSAGRTCGAGAAVDNGGGGGVAGPDRVAVACLAPDALALVTIDGVVADEDDWPVSGQVAQHQAAKAARHPKPGLDRGAEDALVGGGRRCVVRWGRWRPGRAGYRRGMGLLSPRDAASAIAFIGDGPGMRPQMARFALTWGIARLVCKPGSDKMD